MAENKLEAILEYLSTCGEQYSPGIKEIAGAIGMSAELTRHMLLVLRDRGYIDWDNTGRIKLVK